MMHDQYVIKIKGIIEDNWSDWLNGIQITTDLSGQGEPVTTLAGSFPDQSALRGVLNKLWDMNATIILVKRSDPEERYQPKDGGKHNE